MPYPSFIPAGPLATIPAREWSKKQASEYREWLLGVIEPRTRLLLAFLEIPDGPSPADLAAIGDRLADLLQAAAFSERASGAAKLTNAGHALAADAGLLVVGMLRSAHPALTWRTVTARTDMSYNLPVLTGFAHRLQLDPVGGSIAEAKAILQGRQTGNVWSAIYTTWAGKVAAG